MQLNVADIWVGQVLAKGKICVNIGQCSMLPIYQTFYLNKLVCIAFLSIILYISLLDLHGGYVKIIPVWWKWKTNVDQ